MPQYKKTLDKYNEKGKRASQAAEVKEVESLSHNRVVAVLV